MVTKLFMTDIPKMAPWLSIHSIAVWVKIGDRVQIYHMSSQLPTTSDNFVQSAEETFTQF